MTPFELWFDKEYGNRPSARSIADIEVSAGLHHSRYVAELELLTDVSAWERMKEAAEAAWESSE